MIVSKRGSIIIQDVKKVATGAVLAGAGAALTYLFEGLVDVDFGEWTPVVVASLAVVSNIVRKWFRETQYR